LYSLLLLLARHPTWNVDLVEIIKKNKKKKQKKNKWKNSYLYCKYIF